MQEIISFNNEEFKLLRLIVSRRKSHNRYVARATYYSLVDEREISFYVSGKTVEDVFTRLNDAVREGSYEKI